MRWPTVTRKTLQKRVEEFLTSENRRFWIHGVRGSGSRTVLLRGITAQKKPCVFFDFGICREANLDDKLLRRRLLDEVIKKGAYFAGNKRDVLDVLTQYDDQIPKKLQDLQHWLIKDDSSPQFKPRFRLNPSSKKKLRDARTVEEIWTSCTDGMNDTDILNFIASLDQEKGLEYVLKATSSCDGSYAFCEIHELFRSPTLQDGQGLYDLLEKSAPQAIFHTTDAITFISCRGESDALTIDEWSEEMAREVTRKAVKNVDDDVWKSIFAGVGGHAAHLHLAVEGIANEIEKPLPSSGPKVASVEISQELRDELIRDDTVVSQRDISTKEKYLRQKHLSHMSNALNEIEWQIQQFESNDIIIKKTIEQKVQLYESIKYICSKPYLIVRENFDIPHLHVAALLDANLLTVKMNPSRVTVANELTRHALIAHCMQQYEDLSTSNKLEYNLHCWKSRKDMVYSLNRLTEYW